jgi:hypothetical protein
MYVKYIQGLFQSWLGTADFVLLVAINSHYHNSKFKVTLRLTVGMSWFRAPLWDL